MNGNKYYCIAFKWISIAEFLHNEVYVDTRTWDVARLRMLRGRLSLALSWFSGANAMAEYNTEEERLTLSLWRILDAAQSDCIEEIKQRTVTREAA